MMTPLSTFLQEKAASGLISWNDQQLATDLFGLTLAIVEGTILETGLLPARYQRNQQMISTVQQLQLFRSKVAVVGAGGLGGYIIEELARLGVGQLIVIDGDVFEEHNLNRQILSSPANLGQVKVEVAAERVATINPAVTVLPVQALLDATNGAAFLSGADCVVDAVDNVASRLELEALCEGLQVPLVHGAIGGWYGHVTTIFPGERSLAKLYRHWQGGKGIEAQLGNPAFTPAVVASFEVAEVCKILLGQGRLLRNRQLNINLLDMEVEEISL
jgi:molybdopterin/thiamine biosynthesis adenylyltransferase